MDVCVPGECRHLSAELLLIFIAAAAITHTTLALCVEIFMRQTVSVLARFTAAAIIFNETQPQFTSGRLLVHTRPMQMRNQICAARNAAFWTCENWTKAVPPTQRTFARVFYYYCPRGARVPYHFATLPAKLHIFEVP
jgi:hypothetical protein